MDRIGESLWDTSEVREVHDTLQVLLPDLKVRVRLSLVRPVLYGNFVVYIVTLLSTRDNQHNNITNTVVMLCKHVLICLIRNRLSAGTIVIYVVVVSYI